MNNKDYFLSLTPDRILDKARNEGWVCPVCGSGEGEKGTGIVLDKKDKSGTHYKCFNCGLYGDNIELIQKKFNLSFSEALNKGYELYGIEENKEYKVAQKVTKTPQTIGKDYSKYYKVCIERNDFSYLKERGISEATQRFFKIGYDPKWNDHGLRRETSSRIIIPTDNSSYLARATDELEENKKLMNKGGKKNLYNMGVFSYSKVVFVVEGEIDCMSLHEIGIDGIALESTGNKNKLVEYIRENNPNCSLVLMLDSDKAGTDSQGYLKEKLQEMFFPFIEAELPEGEDPNSYLVKDRESFTSLCYSLKERAIDKLRETSGAEYNSIDVLDYFRNIENQPKGFEAKTGFRSLDDMNKNLFGGLHEGLMIIGAISSLGKTTFCIQLADQIARKGQDVIFFSLEQSRYELISKNISRQTYINSVKGKKDVPTHARMTNELLNNRNYVFLKDYQKLHIQNAIEDCRESSEHLFIYEGRYLGERLSVNHIKMIVKKHYEKTGNLPVVFIDYLQILSPVDLKATDKQNTDIAVFELKELSRQYGIPVVAISSFNRDNYTEPVNMTSFKESGAIEYSSDLLFGIQYEGMDYREGETTTSRQKRIRDLINKNNEKKRNREPIQIELKCLKNRNGNLFNVRFNFINAYNHFEEVYFDPDRDTSEALKKNKEMSVQDFFNEIGKR